ncbi:MAG: lipase family protein [Fimbriimonadaceae bacterium]|nr:lipase family protein [Fimbriimonadaceae bacterium]
MLPNFDPTKSDFTVENAYVLMRACQATYAEDEASYWGRLGELGIVKQKWIASRFDACFLGWNADFAILAFRGTANAGGWVSNIARSIPESRPRDYYGKIHPGFADGLDSLWEGLLAGLKDPDVAGKPLFITGHSRGGALATLAAQSLVYVHLPAVAVYTYGAPRVGNSAFAAKYDIASHYRVENDKDIVPHVPPRPLSSHVGQRHWIDSTGQLQPPTDGESPASPVVLAAIQMAVASPAGVGGLGLQSQLASEFYSDHANTEYAYWLWKALSETDREDARNSPYP